MKIASVVGARPQFIKLAPLDKKIRERGHDHVIIHTGQHYDYEMSKAFFDQLDIAEPDYDLEIGSGTHAAQTGQMLTRLGETLPAIKPDLVLVYGDTNSTLAGALAAVKLHMPVGHVEAGYRSHDISMPEEVNRVIVDRVSQLLFAPTPDAIDNLIGEGHAAERVFHVGNIMAESLLGHIDRLAEIDVLEKLGLEPKSYAVLTVHRPENTDERARLTAIVEGVATADFPVVFPAHPRTAKLLEAYGLKERMAAGNIRLAPPMKYLEFAKLQAEAKLILTDSGGMQEEALILGVPCATLRYNTERVATLVDGVNKLVGAESDLIAAAIESVAAGSESHNFNKPPKWDRRVSERILTAIEDNSSLLSIEPEVAKLT